MVTGEGIPLVPQLATAENASGEPGSLVVKLNKSVPPSSTSLPPESVAVGATFSTVTDSEPEPRLPATSVTPTVTVDNAGPSRNLHVTLTVVAFTWASLTAVPLTP